MGIPAARAKSLAVPSGRERERRLVVGVSVHESGRHGVRRSVAATGHDDVHPVGPGLGGIPLRIARFPGHADVGPVTGVTERRDRRPDVR